GVLERQQRLEVVDTQRRQPGPQLSQRERLVVELGDDVGRVGACRIRRLGRRRVDVVRFAAGEQREAALGQAFAVDARLGTLAVLEVLVKGGPLRLLLFRREQVVERLVTLDDQVGEDRKSTRLNSSHANI